jgi:hypothetical protein
MLNHDVLYTTIGTKPSVDFDPSIAPFNMTVACTVTTGPAAYSMQFTIDDFSDPLKTDATAAWFDSVDIPVGTATSMISIVTTPITRARLVIATLTAGSIRFQTQQGMSTN